MYQIIKRLRDKLLQQKNENFYGSIAGTVCSNCTNIDEIVLFNKRAYATLSSIVAYIEERFEFNGNKFEKLSIFNLDSDISFDDFSDVVKLFSIKNIDMDVLFDEYLSLKMFIKSVQKDQSVEEKWKGFLNSGTFTNFEKICNFIFSIPHSNASTERIFSFMFLNWRKERNRLLIKNIESELIIKTNFGYSCKEFYSFLNTETGRSIIEQVQKSEKYN